jgi:hypothetical protein
LLFSTTAWVAFRSFTREDARCFNPRRRADSCPEGERSHPIFVRAGSHTVSYAPQSAKGKDPNRPIQEKESYRCIQGFEEAMQMAALLPDTQVISLADREADIFELFDYRRC